MPTQILPTLHPPNQLLDPEWEARRRALAAVGLDTGGGADGAAWQHVLPGCRSVVVVASSGRALWNAFVADLRAHPEHLTGEAHPLDAFVVRSLARLDPEPDPERRWVRCAAEPEMFVDFRPLAADAGLGWTSRVGLLLHPEAGLWISLRAACFTIEALPVSRALVGEGPCGDCPAPCEPACPGGAVGDDGWSVAACARFHQESRGCHGRCDARLACPVGAGHAHGLLQHHYHNARDTGRPLLARLLGAEDERYAGVGPHWESWSPAG